MSDPQMLGFANGIVNNLSAIAQNLATAFVGNAYMNTFTMSAAATKTVTDANVKQSSLVVVFPLNAAAATLQGSNKCLYTTASNGSFTASTASGVAAVGTELFGVLILNLPVG